MAAIHTRRNNARAKAKALEALRCGMSMTAAARAAGVARCTLYAWQANDPKFREAIADAIEAGTDLLEDALAGKGLAMDDHASVRACEILLKARRPERFRERHSVKHSGVLRIDEVMRDLYGAPVIEGAADEVHSLPLQGRDKRE